MSVYTFWFITILKKRIMTKVKTSAANFITPDLRVHSVTRLKSLRVLPVLLGERSNLRFNLKRQILDCFAPFYFARNDSAHLCNIPFKLGLGQTESVYGFSQISILPATSLTKRSE